MRAFVRANLDKRRRGIIADLAHLPGGIGGDVDLVVRAVVAAGEADEFVDKSLDPFRRARQPELARIGQDDCRGGADQIAFAFVADLANGGDAGDAAGGGGEGKRPFDLAAGHRPAGTRPAVARCGERLI
jgi:hypothetical protein